MRFRAKKLRVKYQKGISIGKRIRVHDGTRIVLSENSILGPDIDFWGGGVVFVGPNSSIGRYSWIYASEKGGVFIGENVLCAAYLYITDTNHNFSQKDVLIKQQGINSKKIIIDNDIWIGAKVTILQGTHISSHSVVGACSVLNRHYPNNSLIVGNPGKVIKEI